MYKDKKIVAIIAAGGTGSRMGAELPKQFLKIDGKPILVLAIEKFAESEEVDAIYIVSSQEHLQLTEHCLKTHLRQEQQRKISGIVAGGDSRQASVYNALKVIDKHDADTDYVLIHDAARPYVSSEIIADVISSTVENGSTISTVKPVDTIKMNTQNGVRTLDRDELHSVQTPQGFKRAVLMEAYKKATEEGFIGTDDASLVERLGEKVETVEGNRRNIKITNQSDLPSREIEDLRIGHGFDVHKFTDGVGIILAGVRIPYKQGLLGHSDADVLTHSVMDALLGPAGFGDIGKIFPDTDPQYKGASSIALLKQVALKLEAEDYRVINIDVTVVAEEPKISSYTVQMQKNIAEAINIEKERVTIKGTTTEGLGFTGRKEGISCTAVALIKK
ncbi:MAG: 2-C-methyl-D-erythritol 4-phosphate cytidylyltransferase [Anaerovoracaceae bacterium]